MNQHSQAQQQINLNTVFTILIGGRTFYISWKSLLSDGPTNFFTRHFMRTKARVVHLDRSPDTFELIIRHLRGYPVVAEDEYQHQDLLNDSHYYGLKRLTKYLKQFVYVRVGDTTFRLKWDLFNKDGPHNYFTGPLKHALLAPHTNDSGQSPPIIIERDPETFKDMIRHLQGYQIQVRDEEHRQRLLSDAQFYLFRRLRDKLNMVTTEQFHSEIVLHIKDIRPSQFQFKQDQIGYLHDKKLFHPIIQLDNVNVSYHSTNSFVLENCDIQPIRDPQWTISKEICIDKDCAIIIQENQSETHLQLTAYLQVLETEPKTQCTAHPNCWITWFGIERALARVSANATDSKLHMSVEKMQVVRSKLQANMKRDFLEK
ncbi:hypothetical protein V8B55DRAFT_1499904 [Mucor lusitanicus]|uniref:BTB domain-containing protein n=2 Tax=Mucor circinelloides f. lusitanicus TaxID=29924 RepID=A0A162TM19_MUCCL|nr:hypothetical protein FB192DRAFT_1357959 [Mucor lusitanicus]OAD05562.1 hypothetical protein MUCCIDRAFT_80646 [Mucor lusitanicus CBS 277.49]